MLVSTHNISTHAYYARDDLTSALLIGLGVPDRDQDAARLRLDAVEEEGGELASAHRGGVAEQDDRGVAGTYGYGPINRGDDLADLGNGEWPRKAAGRGAVGAALPRGDPR